MIDGRRQQQAVLPIEALAIVANAPGESREFDRVHERRYASPPMCGRFARNSSCDTVAAEFGVARFVNVDLRPRFNIAPGSMIEAVVEDKGERRVGPMLWGFAAAKTKPYNARAETVATSPLFREAFGRRRCLVIADGFYEWRREGRTKTPFFFHLRNRKPFAFAAIWTMESGTHGARTASCAIVTCAPNSVVAPIHDRMPVVLPDVARDLWLDRHASVPELLDVLVPWAGGELVGYEVGDVVNSVENDGAICARPVRG